MTWTWARALLGLATLAAPREALAQRGHEIQLHAVGTLAEADFLGAGPGFAWRTGRSRVGLGLAAGATHGEFGARGELAAHFLLNPASRRAGFYGGGGIAGFHDGGETHGYVLLVLGLETNPGGRQGWVVEAGLGGGVRILLGYRWRSLVR